MENEIKELEEKCVLSEEEIIEIIKDFLDLREIHSSDAMAKSFLSIYKEAIQGLLDLYNKEKEKNKELDRENQALYESINCDDNTMLAKLYQKEKEKNKELTDEYLIQRDLINAEFLNENYISKDKIIEKIEEYEEILQSSIIKEDYKKEVEHIIRVLEELKGE